jgi:hypothetical protein
VIFLMLKQKYRRRWWDGWQLAAALMAVIAAIAYVSLHSLSLATVSSAPADMIMWIAASGILGALLWLPIAKWSWRRELG